MVLLSKKALETKDAKELFAWLKAQGDKATVGFAGVGSNSYICATLLQQLLGVKLAMVPYRGTGPAMIDLVAGQIDVLCDQATTAVPQIQGGTVKAYAVTSRRAAGQHQGGAVGQGSGPARVQRHDLERALRAQGRAQGGGRQGQRRDRQDGDGPGHPGALCGHRHATVSRRDALARRACEVPQRASSRASRRCSRRSA